MIMEEVPTRPPMQSSWLTLLVQQVLGIGCYLFFVLPYLGGHEGFNDLDGNRRYLFVSNHVSLLDTILLGGLFWSRQRVPLLVLGDAMVWQETWIRRLLSARLGFLIERDKKTKARIGELQSFGRSSKSFNLLVFPEGTRGDGMKVRRCQPGIYFAAEASGLDMVPVFIEGMQEVSSKRHPFRPFSGLKKIRLRFGRPIPPEEYLALDRDAMTEMVREKIQALSPQALA